MELALFDLDDTLLCGDSDKAWNNFIATEGLVKTAHFLEQNEQFHRDYHAGTLDIFEYYAFSLNTIKQIPIADRQTLQQKFVNTIIKPMITPAARKLVADHQSQGHLCAVITATHRYITAPIVPLFNIEHLIASDPEVVAGEFTGKIIGDPCFQIGKLSKLKTWLETLGLSTQHFKAIHAYSDSHNDLPLLEYASAPTVVNPDSRLAALALERKWPQLKFAVE